MVTADQLMAHALGDYVLQSDWMARDKTKKTFVALIHCVFYSIPFYFWFHPCWDAMVVIAGTHFLIDRFRLARFVCYLKNFISPPFSTQKVEASKEDINPLDSIHVMKVTWRKVRWWRAWRDCSATGYPDDNIPFISTWLLIITDNLMHVLINGFAIQYVQAHVLVHLLQRWHVWG